MAQPLLEELDVSAALLMLLKVNGRAITHTCQILPPLYCNGRQQQRSTPDAPPLLPSLHAAP